MLLASGARRARPRACASGSAGAGPHRRRDGEAARADLRAAPAALDELGSRRPCATSPSAPRLVYGLPVETSFELPPSEGPASEIDTAAYRIVQECLRNAARHANASHVSVELRAATDICGIRVRDDGRGSERATRARASASRDARARGAARRPPDDRAARGGRDRGNGAPAAGVKSECRSTPPAAFSSPTGSGASVSRHARTATAAAVERSPARSSSPASQEIRLAWVEATPLPSAGSSSLGSPPLPPLLGRRGSLAANDPAVLLRRSGSGGFAAARLFPESASRRRLGGADVNQERTPALERAPLPRLKLSRIGRRALRHHTSRRWSSA